MNAAKKREIMKPEEQPLKMIGSRSVPSASICVYVRSWKHLPINFTDLLPPHLQRRTKLVRAGKSASHAHAYKRRLVLRQHRFPFKTPPPQDAFHPPKLTVTLD